jgi:hypothetical protein
VLVFCELADKLVNAQVIYKVIRYEQGMQALTRIPIPRQEVIENFLGL